MKNSECAYVGNILKPHGVKGELSAKFEAVFLKNFNKKKFVLAEIYEGDELVPFFIETAEADERGFGKIKFDNYNSIEEIRFLSGKKIYLPFELLPKTVESISETNPLIGFSVIDKKYGELGRIEEIMESSHQKILLVKMGEKEILIPFVKELIAGTDKKTKILFTKIPEGLLEL